MWPELVERSIYKMEQKILPLIVSTIPEILQLEIIVAPMKQIRVDSLG